MRYSNYLEELMWPGWTRNTTGCETPRLVDRLRAERDDARNSYADL